MNLHEFQQRYKYSASTDSLGEGGFGEVFKAYDTHRDRWVAIKIAKVLPGLENVRLKKEVEMVAQLASHPNIAYYEECYTFSSFDGEYDFGILQYYEEGNLLQLLNKNILSPEQKQSVLTQILHGLDFLHKNGIIHRDLKPQNVLIVKRGNEYIPKITDFGISKKLDHNKSSIFSNSLVGAGTLAYSSPEQLNANTIRKNTDLWSFGVIAFQTFTGQLPFNTGEHANTGESGRVELYRQINSGQFSDKINTIAQPWQTLIRQCMTPDAEVRVKNCDECIDLITGNKKEKTEWVNDAETKYETKIEPVKCPVSSVQTTAFEKEIVLPPSSAREKKSWIAVVGFGILVLIIGGIYMLNSDNSVTAGLETSTVDPLQTSEIAMIHVPGGTFTMGCTSEQGSDCESDEKPAHQVTVNNFYIGKYEVTQKQWESIMGSNPSYFKGDNLPVEQVSWDDIQTFINKLNEKTGKNYRLPTEAEWEYAARGGSQSKGYKYSGSNTVGAVSWYADNSGSTTHAVGGKQANELGIYDMSGNVWEWCYDWYGDYSSASQTNPTGASTGSLRVIRGGTWGSIAGGVRSSDRGDSTPDLRNYFLGFRLSCSSK